MSEDEFDWHASELAQTNPNVMPPEVPDTARAVAGEVEANADAPELVEISTVRVLSDLVGTRLEPPGERVPEDAPAPATPSGPSSRWGRSAWLLVLAVLGLALAAWGLAG